MFAFEQFDPNAQREGEETLSRGRSWFFRLGQRIYCATQADYVSGGCDYAVKQAQKRTAVETLQYYAFDRQSYGNTWLDRAVVPGLEAELG